MDEERIPLVTVRSDKPASDTALRTQPRRTKNALGTINGCFVPCSLTIMSGILFLRLGWATGEAGILQTIGMLLIGEAMTSLTALSLSAIVTNGDMHGGGSYYMISRSLGPEYGGAIGTCFYLAYSVGVSFHAISVGTEIQETWLASDDTDPKWTVIWLSSCMLFSILLVAFAGAHVFTRFNVGLFVVELSSIIIGLVSFVIPHDYKVQIDNDTLTARVDFPSHFVDNLHADYSTRFTDGADDNPCHGSCSFQVVFSIIFPMVTGIMEGANLSGDLKTPARSIPIGTLAAIAFSGTFYLIIILIQGASFDRHWLVSDLSSFQNATYGSRYIVVIGILIASYSSALGAIFGGSRLLQAISRDGLFPFLKVFSFGSRKGDEPMYAYLLTWAIAQCCLFMGSLELIAGVITAFFCLAYSLVNLTCLLLAVTGVPNFRPRFKYFSVWTAFLGFAINLGVMFFINWMYALIGLSALTFIFIYLLIRGPAKNWGEISQALMFHQVRKYLLLLDPTGTHSKFWRPNILLLTDNPSAALIGFCGCLKWGGILVLGHGIAGAFDHLAHLAKPFRIAWVAFTKHYKIKAFPQVVIAPDYRSSAESLMLGAGLGGLSCNTVCVPLLKLDEHGAIFVHPRKANREAYNEDLLRGLSLRPSDADRSLGDEELSNLPVRDCAEYCGILRDTLRLELNLLVACNYTKGFHTAVSGPLTKAEKHFVGLTSARKYTDVWIVGDIRTSAGFGSLSAIWGYADSGLKAHDPSLFSVQHFIDGGDDNDATAPSTGLQGLVAFLLQLGSIADGSRLRPEDGKKHPHLGKLRILHVSSSVSGAMDSLVEREESGRMLRELCLKARIDIDPEHVKVITPIDIFDTVPLYRQICAQSGGSAATPLHLLSSTSRALVLNELIQQHSADTCQVITALPMPTEDADEVVSRRYVEDLGSLTKNLPPTILVCNGEDCAYISTCI